MFEQDLYKAIKDNDIPRAGEIIRLRRTNLDWINPGGEGDGSTLLIFSIHSKSARIARMLVEAGADVNKSNDGSLRDDYTVQTPLYEAVSGAILDRRLFLNPNRLPTNPVADEEYAAIFNVVTMLFERNVDCRADRAAALQTVVQGWSNYQGMPDLNLVNIENLLAVFAMFDQAGACDALPEDYTEPLPALREAVNQQQANRPAPR